MTGVRGSFFPFLSLPRAGTCLSFSTARGDSLGGKELTGLAPVPEQATVNNAFVKAAGK